MHPNHTPKMEAIRGDIPGVILSRHILIEGTRVPYQDVVAAPGDLLIFDGGRNAHEVLPVRGPRSRWTIGGFLGWTQDGAVLAWA